MNPIDSVIQEHSHQKLLLIGLDAADWDLLSEKTAQGKLPNFTKLIKRGASGPLRSLRPLFSPSLWATIATGKRPYQHNITGFVLPTVEGRGLRTYNSSSRSAPAIWEMLSSAHRTSTVIGWWNSAPAEKIRGIIVDETFRVAQFPCNVPWRIDPTSVSPSSLAEELAPCRVHPQQLSMSLLQRLIPKLYEIDPTVDWRLSAIAKIFAEDLTTMQTTLYLMKHYPSDFTSLYLIGLDSFSHQGTSFREPITCNANPLGIEHYGELIDRSYDLYDEWVGMLVSAAGEDTTIILLSDHGFYHDYRKPASLGIHTTAPCDQHAPIGTLIAAGPSIKQGVSIQHASLLDICPTLLALSGLPIGRDMKGKVLFEIFKRPPSLSFVNSWDQIVPRLPQSKPEDPPAQTTELALRQLIALGYLPAAPQDHHQIISTAYTDHLFHQALSFLEHDRIDATIRLLEQAHDDSPERTDILAVLAHCYWILGANEQAALTFKKLVYHRRRDAWQAYQALQTKNYNSTQSLSTIEILEWRHLTSRVSLDNEGMHFSLIFAEWLVHREEEQAKHLCEFAERRPHDFFIVMQASEAALFHGWSEQGLSLLRTLANWSKAESSPLVVMAEHEIQRGNFEQAILLSQEALARHPVDYAAWLELGKALASQARWEEASQAALQATESFLKRPQAYNLLALIAHQEKPDLALRYEKLAHHFSKRLKRLQAAVQQHPHASENSTSKSTRIFHSNCNSLASSGLPSTVDPAAATPHVSTAAYESLTETGLNSDLNLSDISNTARRLNPRPPFLHDAAQRLAKNQHKISELTRIFHPSVLRKPGRPMDTALDLNLDSDSMDTHSHRPSSAPALSHQPSHLPRNESDEISGLSKHQYEKDQYYASLHSSQEQPIIVTGLPRSGTSLLMQMLTAGGIDAITDYQRLPDKHNPLGYFEHEKIKEIRRYPELLTPGKAAKVVIPLLWDLPRDLGCHVILIRRPLEEVITSQHHMAGAIVPFKELQKSYISFEIQTTEIIRQRPWSVLQLSHTQLLTDPIAAAEKINAFLGGYLDVKAMAAAVQPSLYRVKSKDQQSIGPYEESPERQ